jgi:hypothetical protein
MNYTNLENGNYKHTLICVEYAHNMGNTQTNITWE